MSFVDSLLDLLRDVLRELRETLRKGKGPVPGFPLRNLDTFHFPEELPTILAIAQRYFPEGKDYPVNPYALLLAIREAERGRRGFPLRMP
ncbi:hypothetical protein [Candidatus Caldatribacterium sp.]|uniref:hypothetical protein n=1 Tax=Candidatus Caldatribacterium sp. TaxID=2282143 RepID=UPI003840CE52|nr:hypothetical protein [Candidatus Caldatribacterium sp.]